MTRATSLLVLLASSAALLAGCDNGTYVLLTLQAGQKRLEGVKRVDIDLALGGRTASARYAPGGDITFPTTAALEIASGEGPLVISANALDSASAILDQGSVKVDVTRGTRRDVTLTFGTFVVDEAPDMLPSDPCAVCDPNALCTLNGGVATCTCQAGFEGDGRTCSDVNECATNNGGCNTNATCVNTPGGARCVCNTGYSGDGYMCTQIWQQVLDADGLDLTRYGKVLGGGQRFFFGNVTATVSAQFFKSFDVTTTPPVMLANLAAEPRPPQGMTSTCADWSESNGCYERSGPFVPVNNGSAFWYFGVNLQYFSATTLTRGWTTAPSADAAAWGSLRRDGASAAAVGNAIYYIGGVSYPGGVQTWNDTVNIFNHPSFTAAGTAAAYPLKIRYAATATANNKVYVFGGRTLVGSQEADTPKSNMFDPSRNAWSPLPDMPFGRYSYDPVFAPTYKGRIFLVDTNRSNSPLQVFNTQTNAWETGPALPATPNSAQTTGWILATVPAPQEALYLINSWVLAGNVKTVVWKYGL
jgi:hypothetical protein